jgi:hypothetical protein
MVTDASAGGTQLAANEVVADGGHLLLGLQGEPLGFKGGPGPKNETEFKACVHKLRTGRSGGAIRSGLHQMASAMRSLHDGGTCRARSPK